MNDELRDIAARSRRETTPRSLRIGLRENGLRHGDFVNVERL
ncbi:hypothetical protein [Salinisphaera sp. C84B14]